MFENHVIVGLAPLLLATACGDDGGSAVATGSATTSGPESTGPFATTSGSAATSTDDGESGTAGASSESGSETGNVVASERLYVGTGEYSATVDWHAILRFEQAQTLDASTMGPADPDGTVNVQASTDAAGTALNFVHTIFVDESRDELWAGALFTTTSPTPCPMAAGCGGIAVFAGASTLDGPQVASRHIFGPNTGIVQPHGIWLDRTRDALYVANTFAGNLLVWDGASTVDGDTPPTRTIETDGLGAPVFVYVDEGTDRAFVAAMPMLGGTEPSVVIYENVSTKDGIELPSFRIAGPSTRLMIGNPTTHNAWWIEDAALLVVAHHTNEVLFYDLGDLAWDRPGPTEQLDLAPRVLEINESDADVADWSAYGVFYRPEDDRLYVAAGYTPSGGGPVPGSDEHAVKIYVGASDPSFAGRVAPDREIRWTNVMQYFPPQPLWVTRD